ncbi:hypothetical protein VI08_18395 [Luteibacter yeojuensis]|uniref:Uncharacterized protein n=1 Tax=Luteibacter yeojuensis TaxID=345309 RepID=A0A0F3K6B1_9GAMM|nr:hypothetical protein VI08_18395 [Luteibacter yeojuensis]
MQAPRIRFKSLFLNGVIIQYDKRHRWNFGCVVHQHDAYVTSVNAQRLPFFECDIWPHRAQVAFVAAKEMQACRDFLPWETTFIE